MLSRRLEGEEGKSVTRRRGGLARQGSRDVLPPTVVAPQLSVSHPRRSVEPTLPYQQTRCAGTRACLAPVSAIFGPVGVLLSIAESSDSLSRLLFLRYEMVHGAESAYDHGAVIPSRGNVVRPAKNETIIHWRITLSDSNFSSTSRRIS